MAKVVFSLTDRQAEALLALQAGRPFPGRDDRHRVRMEGAMRDRGLIEGSHQLTPLGQAAALVCARLAIPQGTDKA